MMNAISVEMFFKKSNLTCLKMKKNEVNKIKNKYICGACWKLFINCNNLRIYIFFNVLVYLPEVNLIGYYLSQLECFISTKNFSEHSINPLILSLGVSLLTVVSNSFLVN